MVECELNTLFLFHIHGKGFNRYMVECEFGLPINFSGKMAVLIDTWWNVNREKDIFINTGTKVLIDTWWNVNVYTRSLVLYLGLVLIDTWWNVNYYGRISITSAYRF